MSTTPFQFPIQRHRLGNGLRVVLAPDPRVPVVAVNLWYAVGSRNEAPGSTGFAHLFEHMMFQGSANVPKNGHFEMIERAGGSLNASTWFDRTNYYETLPAHQVELALWLESDRLGGLLEAMTAEKLRNQKDVVKNEKRERYDNQPYGDWDERMLSLVFPKDHPYAHTVIGSMEDIEAATLDDVASFFRTWYRPDNAALTLAGDIDPGPALELVERHFGHLEPGGSTPPLPGRWQLPARIGGTRTQRVTADVPLGRVYLGCRIPVYGEDAHYDARVAAAVAGSGRASRLFERLVRKDRVAREVGSFTFPLLSGSSLAVFWATCYPGGDPESLADRLASELEALRDVTDGEVDRAVALAETQATRRLERVAGRADLLSSFELFFDAPERALTEVERIRAVTPARVQSFAREYLGPENRAVLTYHPEGEE